MSDIGPWGSRDGRQTSAPVAQPRETIASSTPGAPVIDKG